jgi:hypothetical protein
MTGWKKHLNETPCTLDEGTDTNWILQDTHTDDNCHEICTDICNGTAKAVSDGSFLSHQKIGVAAWIIESSNSNYSHKGHIICPGLTKIQYSHQSELIGFLGMIYHINQICTTNNIADGQVEIGCDGMGAISAITSQISLIRSSWKHFDLVSLIQKLMYQSSIQWEV